MPTAGNELTTHEAVGYASENTSGFAELVLASNVTTPPPCIAATTFAGPSRAQPATVAAPTYPIDLASALKLGGANSLQIQFTQERLLQARAQYEGAKALWLPTLTVGPGYLKHDGRIQATEGSVVEASRNAVFIGTSPTTVLGGGPISTIDVTNAIFEPLAACQIVRANEAAVARTMNDSLLAVALAYLDLVEAGARLRISQLDVDNAQQLVKLTEAFAATGEGLESDAARARNELATRQRERLEAEEASLTRSVRLANLLRLDPAITLRPADLEVTPVQLITEDAELTALIVQAQTVRPENEEWSALVQASYERVRQERWRPFIPRVLADVSSGGFGGGVGSHFAQFSDRSDITAMAVWELRNMGLGNRALRQEREAQAQQAETTGLMVKEMIAAEVAEAFQQVKSRSKQIELAQRNVVESGRSLELNMLRIRGGEGLPIETLQAIQAVATARRAYLTAVVEHNRSQFQLLRAIGQPPRDQ